MHRRFRIEKRLLAILAGGFIFPLVPASLVHGAEAALITGPFLLVSFCLMTLAGFRWIISPYARLADRNLENEREVNRLNEIADIAELSNDFFVSTDLAGRITWVNQAFTDFTGYTLQDVQGRAPGVVLQGPDTDPDVRQSISDALASFAPIRTEILNYRKDGTPFWCAISIAPQYDADGRPHRFVAISSDITERRQTRDEIHKAKATIEFQAFHDPLTGLPNRRALDAEIDKIKASGELGRVLIRIDLDHFKNVNDTLGHAAGDHVLRVVSLALRDMTRKSDMAARVGGDEFVILMGPEASHSDGTLLAERILEEFQKEILFEGKVCRIGASFGVASTRKGMLGAEELLLSADSALYNAKEQGRNKVVSYTETLHESVVASREIAQEIETAIKNDEFEPFFQPQFDAKSFEFMGMEALMRWRHPKRGILAPARFLHIAQQRSMVGEIDRRILYKSLRIVDDLNSAGFSVPKVSFNVDANQLEEPDLPERARLLSDEGTVIAFEVLESVLLEEQSNMFSMRVDQLRDSGYAIEVDDFGSGHASIIGLMQLSPDTMKIDQRLIFPITDSPVAQQMVRAIVEIGKALNMGITAEGVETAEHARFLAEVGCDTLQGYYFAKPMSGQDLISFLTAYDPEAYRAECDMPVRDSA